MMSAAIRPAFRARGYTMWLISMGVGAVLGAVTAIRRGGRKLDALQYAAGFGIAFGLAGLAITILIARLI